MAALSGSLGPCLHITGTIVGIVHPSQAPLLLQTQALGPLDLPSSQLPKFPAPPCATLSIPFLPWNIGLVFLSMG